MNGSCYLFLLLFNLSSILHGFFFYIISRCLNTQTIYGTAEEENMKEIRNNLTFGNNR